MYLIDEKYVVLLQIRQQRCEVSRLADGGAGGYPHVDAHFIGYDSGQRGFAKSRGAVEQHVIERLTAHLGGLYEHLKILLDLLLADVLPQGARAQGELGGVLRQYGRRGNVPLLSLVGKADAQACSPHFIMFFSAAFIISSVLRAETSTPLSA